MTFEMDTHKEMKDLHSCEARTPLLAKDTKTIKNPKTGKSSRMGCSPCFAKLSELCSILTSDVVSNGQGKANTAKLLTNMRRRINDVAVCLGLIGIFLMIWDMEYFMRKSDGDGSHIPLRICISGTTLLLLCILIFYHIVDIKLYMVKYGIQSFQVVLDGKRKIMLAVELFVCLLHVPPGIDYLSGNASHEGSAIVIILSGCMFFRIFLVCRALTLHSKFNSETSNKSLTGFGKISTDFPFVFKCLLLDYPMVMIFGLFVMVLFIASFFMHACETCLSEANALNYLDALWVVVITFLTVGYGDVTPKSVCGRTVSVLSGVIGVIITVYIIAIVAQNMELSRSQKRATNFLTKIKLNKDVKNSAASVIQNAWLIHKSKIYWTPRKMKIYQAKYFESVRVMQTAKNDIDELMTASIDMFDLHSMLEMQNDWINDMEQKQQEVDIKMAKIGESLLKLHEKLDNVQTVTTNLAKRQAAFV